MARLRRFTGRITPAVMNQAPADDPDTGLSDDTGSSTTVPPNSSVGILQHVELTVRDLSLSAFNRDRDAAKATNTFLRTYGRIPLVCPEGTHGRRSPLVCAEGPYQDLNAVAALSADDGTRPRPLVCVFCKCAFCFSVDEVPDLQDGHYVYPEPEVPITLNLLTPAAVEPLESFREPPPLPRRGVLPPRPPLLVCDSDYHFRITMGMQQRLLPGGAPGLDWLCACCLSVIPIVVGTATPEDLRHATNAVPPRDPLAYARAFWDYVEPGDEGLVELHLHDDPLNLTLGRR